MQMEVSELSNQGSIEVKCEIMENQPIFKGPCYHT